MHTDHSGQPAPSPAKGAAATFAAVDMFRRCAPRTRSARRFGRRWTARGSRGSLAPRAGSEFRRGAARGRKALGAPPLAPGADDQGQSRLAADARAAGGAGGRQDGDHGRAPAPRPPPVPGARPEIPLQAGAQGGGDDQGSAQTRSRGRPRRAARDRLLVCGSVAVNLSGARVGKGGGYSDLEYGILIDAGKIDNHTTVATTVHPTQILRRHLMMTAHDLPIDLIATPRAVIDVERQYERPRGILWDHLQPPQIPRSPSWNAWATPRRRRGGGRRAPP